MSGKAFKSAGTIMVRIGPNSARKMKIFFTPDAEHSGPGRGGKPDALFVQSANRKKCVKAPVSDSGKGVPIRVKPRFAKLIGAALIGAAIQQTLVDIAVTRKHKGAGWTLRAITIPSAGQTK